MKVAPRLNAGSRKRLFCEYGQFEEVTEMAQNKWFTLVFLGSIVGLAGMFLWGVQCFPLVPQPPPPVTLGPASLAAMAHKDAALHNDTPQLSSHNGIVEIDIHNVLPLFQRPLESLVVGLGRYPKAVQFRMRWHGYWGRHGSVTEAFYDRHKHLLFSTCDVNEVPWGSYHDRSVFRNVTEATLRRDALDHKRPRVLTRDVVRQRAINGDLDTAFVDLPDYGCARQPVH